LKNIFTTFGIILGCGTLLFPSDALAASKKILLIQSYHNEYPWDASYKAGLKKGLGDGYDIESFELDTKRLPKDKVPEMVKKAWEKYESLKPDLVVLGDDAALKNLGPRFAETKTPFVYLGINNNPRKYFTTKPTNMSGVLERPLVKRSIIYLKEIYPTAKNILVMFDTDITAQITREESNFFGGKDDMVINGINIHLKTIGTWSDWKKTVTDLKGKYDAVVVGLYQTIKDDTGKQVDAEEVIRWTSQNTPVPPFCLWDFAAGEDKTVGGMILYGEDQGAQAAVVVKKIFSGTPPNEIPPIVVDEGKFLFSKKQLEKWKIKLPTGISSQATFIN
jgi:ABC-type uncharacterized transport system substrate-binding protein